jgi:polygalacturonase
MGSAAWTTRIMHSKNITIDNVKILGGRAQNDDGIDLCNSQNILITNCFIRTDDDCIALKGLKQSFSNDNVERIKVENSVLWCDRARIFLLGHESRAEYMRDLIFKNIDIVHFRMTPFLLEPGENMRLENVLFEDIRINGEGQNELIRLKPTINQYMKTKIPGLIRNITFKNIQVLGMEGPYKIQIIGADKDHDVRNVNLIDVSILGRKLTEKSEKLEIGNYVREINIQ